LALEAVLLIPDSLPAQEPDSAGVQAPDSVEAQAVDTAAVPDSLAVVSFPLFPEPASRVPGLAAEWGLHDLLMTGALTFGGLLEYTPFLDQIRVGFLEGPHYASFSGRGPASLRFNQDGYEIVPILGGPLDLNLISLVELQNVRLVAEPGGYRAYSQTYRNDSREPYSRIESGTGDRRTNLLRGILSSRVATALVGFGFDRVDTQGLAETGKSTRTVVWANLSHPLPLGVWGQAEYRGTTTERESFANPKRSDWLFRLRRAFADGWNADIIAGRGTLEREPLDEAGDSDSILVKETASQVAVRAAKTAGRWQTYLSARWWNGENLPIIESEGSLEFEVGSASLYAAGHYGKWDEFHTGGAYGALHLGLPLGLRFLGEAEIGDRALFGVDPRLRMAYDRWSLGLELKLGSWRAGARAGQVRSEPSPGVGAPIDSLNSLAGGRIGVAEAWAGGTLFKLLGGRLGVGGRYLEREQGAFFYWPLDEWRLEGTYRVLALNDQLEVLATGLGGVRGSMWVTDQEFQPGSVISSGDLNWWHLEIVVRIKDFFIWYNYQYYDSIGVVGDIPGFNLPATRYHFGVKWEFWN
jgi:hypothetical protein